MDWDQIDLPEVKNTRIQCASLPELEFFKIQVSAAMSKRSAAEIMKTAGLTYLSRNWETTEARLITKARQLGISKEELFNRIINEENIE